MFTISAVLHVTSRLFILRSSSIFSPFRRRLFFVTDKRFVHFLSHLEFLNFSVLFHLNCIPKNCSLLLSCSPNNCSSVLASHLVLSRSQNCSLFFFFPPFLLFLAFSAVLRITSHLSQPLYFSLAVCSFLEPRHLSCSSYNL